MACPLNIDGETAAILVSWSETLGKGESLQSVFNSYPVDIQTVDERVYRAAHLIVNDPDLVAGTAQDPSTAATFLRKLDECAQSLNYGGVQDGMPFPIDELRSNRSFRDELAIKLIQVLADPSCGLPRARLWVRNGRGLDAKFSVWHSWTDPGHTTTNKPQIDAYSGIEVTQDDPYVQYSLARFKTDPYARHQHESMFGIPDDNNGELDKTPNCPWIVGLIANSQLWGFLSADDHYPNMPNSYLVEGLDEPPRKAFQRRCVDLVCHFLSSVIFCEALSRVSTKTTSVASLP
jgi:hypothetical protein